jgi:Icc-related predicted phosphoesterase
VIRIAAIGDLHFGIDSAGTYRPHLGSLHERADLLLLAGDLTRLGRTDEAAVLAHELRDLPVPALAVLGNHDVHSGEQTAVRGALEDVGVTVLEEEGVVVEVEGGRVGVAGSTGFGGGFPGGSASDFGEPEMKAFVARTTRMAEGLERALGGLDADVKVALSHYSPVRETLEGEPPEIHAFLGSCQLAEAIDRAGADVAIHGHAHRGSERGRTAGGVPVRNVAWPVIERAYALLEFAAPGRARERVSSGETFGRGRPFDLR